MATVVYKSLSTLSPIDLEYNYYKNENLHKDLVTYNNGLEFFQLPSFNNYQDLAFNKESCFVLTSSIPLDYIFKPQVSFVVGQMPASFVLQPRSSVIYFVDYNDTRTIFTLSLSAKSIFFISPIKDTGEVELFINNRYVQVDEDYPYNVRLNQKSLDPEDIHRQRFIPLYQDGLLTLKTKTNSGYRYLALTRDNILRATGVILANSVINDYCFKAIMVTSDMLKRGFNPTNNWVTYYFDVESKQENKSLTINKNLTDLNNHFLFDFPLEPAAQSGVINTNIANLKTAVTPEGGPSPIENSYTKESLVTTN